MRRSILRSAAAFAPALFALAILPAAELHAQSSPPPSFEGLGLASGGSFFPTASTTASVLSRDGSAVLASGFAEDGGPVVDRWRVGSGWERLVSASIFGGAAAGGLSEDGLVALANQFYELQSPLAQLAAPLGRGPLFETYDSVLCPPGAFGRRAGHLGSALSSSGDAAAGSVACQPFQSGSPPESLATRFLPSGAQVLGVLPGDSASAATGISADGEVVVGISTGASGFRAFRWTGAGGMEALPVDPDTTASVSADGTGVAGSSIAGAAAYLWNEGLGATPLGDLPGGTTETRVAGLSADGSVVFGRSRSASGEEAFRFTRAGGIVGLGDLPGGAFASRALASTVDGATIFGSSQTGASTAEREAFVWSEGTGMRRVLVVLAGHGLPVAGWTLYDVTAVSSDGRTWLGNGRSPGGVEQPWLATIPAPSPIRACENGTDDDGDGLVDLADPGCNLLQLASESPQCSDAIDDDGDGAIDFPADALCQGAWDDDEAANPASSCGLLGLEALVVLAAFRRRRGSPARVRSAR